MRNDDLTASGIPTMTRSQRRLTSVFNLVAKEVDTAEKLHGVFSSAHEAYAVLLEEVDEFKAEVWKKPESRDMRLMRNELIQIAAVALRYIVQSEMSVRDGE